MIFIKENFVTFFNEKNTKMEITAFERACMASMKFFSRKTKSMNKAGLRIDDLVEFGENFSRCLGVFAKNPHKKKLKKIKVLENLYEKIKVFQGELTFYIIHKLC